MARVKTRGVALFLLALAALPLLGTLSSSFLREAVFHGFFPSGLPLAIYCALFLFPYSFALLFAFRRWPLPPGSRKITSALCGVIALVALLVIATRTAPCTAKEFKLHGLSCEIEKATAAEK